MDNLKNILIIGGGGREHAIAESLAFSKDVGRMYCIPGNAGIAEIAECHSSIGATDLDAIVDFVEKHSDIYMTVVAPDDPLSLGLVNKLNEKGFRAFGPTKLAAEIESSKVFSKGFMERHGIPTARHKAFSDYNAAKEYLNICNIPIVIKADGLALGKGVSVCLTREDAFEALKRTMEDKAFGQAGSSVVIEEFLTGFEVSVLAFCDGTTVVPMVSATDYKRAYDGNEGPNTGGMGTISPAPGYTKEIAIKAMDTIFIPTVKGLKNEGREFKGILYFGLIIDDSGTPKIIEYNARFGDPETQVVLPKLKTDLLEIFDACIDGSLANLNIEWHDSYAVCVCLASGGYPLAYEKGKQITLPKKLDDDVILYHAGTKLDDSGALITNGGRVLNVVALAKTQKSARELVYKNLKKIKFDGAHYRTDIAK